MSGLHSNASLPFQVIGIVDNNIFKKSLLHPLKLRDNQRHPIYLFLFFFCVLSLRALDGGTHPPGVPDSLGFS